MKYKPLIFLSFSLLAAGCDNKSETPPTTMVETQKNISRKSANEYLTCDDTIVLKRINSQTLNKIQKNERLELIDIVSMQRSGIQPDTIIHLLNITQSRFNLNAAEIIKLQNEGISFKVISFMSRTNDLLADTTPPSEPPPPKTDYKNVPDSPTIIVSKKNPPPFFISIGPLLEQVRISGSQYAYTKNGDATQAAALPASGDILEPSFGLDWGITAGVGYYFQNKNWALKTRFDWIPARGNGSQSVNGSDNIIPINIWREQFFADLGADLGVAGSGRSHFKIDYFNLNLDLDKALYIDKNFTLEPHIGVKVSFIYDRVTSTFSGNGSDTSLAEQTDLNNNILTRKQKSNFWGVGPSMGFNSDWNIKGPLSLFFEGTGSILVGKSLAQDYVYYSALVSSQTTSFSPNLPVLSPALQGLIGLKYEKNFCNDAQKIMIKLGWDNSFYWNQWNHINTVSASTYDSSMETFQLQEGNTFGLTGLLLEFSWSF